MLENSLYLPEERWQNFDDKILLGKLKHSTKRYILCFSRILRANTRRNIIHVKKFHVRVQLCSPQL